MGFFVLIIVAVFIYIMSIANMHVVCKKLPLINQIPKLWKKFTQPKQHNEDKKYEYGGGQYEQAKS